MGTITECVLHHLQNVRLMIVSVGMVVKKRQELPALLPVYVLIETQTNPLVIIINQVLPVIIMVRPVVPILVGVVVVVAAFLFLAEIYKKILIANTIAIITLKIINIRVRKGILFKLF